MKFQAAGILLFTLLAAGCSAQSPSCEDPETLAKLKEAVVKECLPGGDPLETVARSCRNREDRPRGCLGSGSGIHGGEGL